jgi:predicted AlkP superfamily pyrophosphatase or phosphodiesterase
VVYGALDVNEQTGEIMNTNCFREEMKLFAKQRSLLNDFVLPDYERVNLKNLSSVLGAIFGVSSLAPSKFPEEYTDELDGVEKVLLMILDGLGYNRLLAHLDNFEGAFSELAERGVLKPITCPFPATTSTSLTSIFTGLPPSQHKILGYHMFSKEYGLIFNTLDMKPVYGYSSHVEIAEEFAGKVKPWMNKLREQDVETYIVTKGSIIGSGLSRVIHQNQEKVSYVLQSDMLERCRKVLEQQTRTLLVTYYSGVDTLEHKYGPYSEETTSEIESVDCNLKNFLNKLSAATKKQTLLILTADHGVAPTSKFYYLKDITEITESLRLPPVGDSRATFLFSKPERNANLRNAFNKKIDGFKLLPSKELIEKGAFGQNRDSQSLEEVVGDFTALSVSQNALQYPFFEEDRTRMQRGTHGGMTAEEIIIPLLSAKLSKF